MQQAAGAGAPAAKSAQRAAQRVDEPVELDGVSYSAEVLSTVEGWFTLDCGATSRGGSENRGGIGAAHALTSAAARTASRVWDFIVISGSRIGTDSAPAE
jgi:hypothetical protein